jgi:hypothetical protein
MTTQEQIDSFYRFATEQLANGGSEKSVDELYDQWRSENRAPEEMAENIAAVRAAIDDMNQGDMGRDAADVEWELRGELNLPSSKSV